MFDMCYSIRANPYHATQERVPIARQSIRFTPFHLAGVLFLFAGLVLAVYHGLLQFDLVPRAGWVSWSHIHFVTIGAFTQLLFGMLPQLTARKLERPLPSKYTNWLSFGGLNGGFLLLWYGRGGGHTWAFDAGIVVIWIVVAALLVVLLRMAMQSDRAWNATVGLYLVSVFVFLWGITYAYGLYAHVWTVPGGWLGLREAHVHANAWGFLGLAAIGTLYDVIPRVLDTDIYSEALKNYSAVFLAAGIFPLITGPWIGMGRTVTASGLVLFAIGSAMYLSTLVRTYQAAPSESRSGIALTMLVAQFWLLGPAGFAPFVLFGVEWVQPAYIEDGALHFFFMGWALPIVLSGLLLFARNLPAGWRPDSHDRFGGADLLPDGTVPDVLSIWTVVAWNLAILVVGVGFFYQDQSWSAYLFGPGYTILVLLWLYALVEMTRLRRTLRNRTHATASDIP